ncbi:4-(cytidine 5'-diphospho)-2-C-methyl-D-erythritol kinase [Aquamicrobium sp. LC103]|uniref:4-(cytidine 5'-diphospho)-2-C-methyl-D-erythritol kinase n=1 Tax=Aquamicrobium sp. LC103 TaxID=1120658 RepID=UPI00063E9A29|nr:4-(cytidine 5'-diphospho)-2-C-methyl-D-erythritol kinase [Aquamicrobium sp. LC103]TKT81104.1 4-(cytidine 5'-diphospho)-2-C-methyl-D-erythritol kinase [Aquamicrobium sp. LC103]
MPDTIVQPAPAKVNLALHVTGRRAGGYHLLDTLAVFTELGDVVTVASSDRDSFLIEGRFGDALAADGENLVLRAREMLRGLASARSGPVAIRLRKDLPVASGIGGGSSDAAATLKALRTLWNLDISDAALAEAALHLGADLPMCLAATPLLARGIGEKLTPVDGFPRLDLVLVNPGVSVSTPEIFRALHSRGNPALPALPRHLSGETLTGWLDRARNDLETPARKIAPVISEALDALAENGARISRMSGSGATCFGIHDDAAAAARAAEAIAARHPGWFVAATTTTRELEADAVA